MKFWRIRRLANATVWSLMLFAVGVLAGVMLVAMLPGMPWANTVPLDANNKDILDLAAQRGMESASWWMVVITIVSNVIGLAGLFAILGTLTQSQRSVALAQQSVEVAREIGRAQTRAYLQVTMDFVAVADSLDRLSVRFVNKGQSPARQVEARVTWSITAVRGESSMADTEVHRIPYLAIGEENEYTAYMTNLAFDPTWAKPDASIQMLIKVGVETAFIDVFGDRIEHPFAFVENLIRKPIFPPEEVNPFETG